MGSLTDHSPTQISLQKGRPQYDEKVPAIVLTTYPDGGDNSSRTHNYKSEEGQMSMQTQEYNEARESIIQAANMVFSSFSDLPKMVQNAKILGEAAAILIRLINNKAGEAEDENVRREMVAQAKKLAAVTQDMVTAIKTLVSNSDDESQREMFRTAVDELISASNLATSHVIECTMKLGSTMKTYGADVTQVKYEMPAFQVGQVKYKTAETQASSAGKVKYQLPAMQSNIQQANIAQVKYGLPTVQVAQVQYQGVGLQQSTGQVKYQLSAVQSGVTQTGFTQAKYGRPANITQTSYQLPPNVTQAAFQLPAVNMAQVKYQLPSEQMRSDLRFVTVDGNQFGGLDSKRSTLDSRNATLGSNISGQILILDSRHSTLDSSQYLSANSKSSTLDSTVTSSTMESFNESSVSSRTNYSVQPNIVDETQIEYNYGVKKGMSGTALVNMSALSQDRKRKHDSDLEQEVRFVEEKKTIYEWGIDRSMSGKAIVNLEALGKRKKRRVRRRKKVVEGYEEYEEYSDEGSGDEDEEENKENARWKMEEPYITRSTIIVKDNGEELEHEDVSPNFEAFFRFYGGFGEPYPPKEKEPIELPDLSDIIELEPIEPEDPNEGLTLAEERKTRPEYIPPDFSAFFKTYLEDYGWPTDPEILGPGSKPIEDLVDPKFLPKDEPDGTESVKSEEEGGMCGPDLLGGPGGAKMFVLPDYDSYFKRSKEKPQGKYVQCELGEETTGEPQKIAVGFMTPYRRIVLACAPADEPKKKAQAQLVRVLKTFSTVATKTIRAVLSTRTRVVYKRTFRRRRRDGETDEKKEEKKTEQEMREEELLKKFEEAKKKVQDKEEELYGQAEGKLLQSSETMKAAAEEAKHAFLKFASTGVKPQESDPNDETSWSKTEVVVSKQSCAELAGLLMQFQQKYQEVLDAGMVLGKHTTVEWHQKCVVKTTKFFSFSATTVIKGARLYTSASDISNTKTKLAIAAQDLTKAIDEMVGVCHEKFPDENAVDPGNGIDPEKLLELLKAVANHAPDSEGSGIKEFKELAAVMAESRGDTRMGKAVQARMELLETYLKNNPDYSGFDFAEYKKRILGF